MAIQLSVFRFKFAIEAYIKNDSCQAKDIYTQLCNVIEFENLFVTCRKNIEKVCSYQIEFWSILANSMPDFNLLNDLGQKIYEATHEAENSWNQLCDINPNYPKAQEFYGNYLIEIKNNSQLGLELTAKATTNSNKRSLDELIKSADILFADDTVVLHVSGSKDPHPGLILKSNQGLSKVFGYTNEEVSHLSVNVLMPEIYARRHNDFLEKFFRTGYQTMFNQEKFYFALHRNQMCFHIKIVLKQIPSLREGIQYVAMIRKTQADYEYILTDMKGVINCYSKGLATIMNIDPTIFHKNEVNIQIFAPELQKIFAADKKKILLDKFKEPGGQKLWLIVPKDFSSYFQNQSKDKHHRKLKIKHKEMSPSKLLETNEYKVADIKHQVKCEIQDLEYGNVYKNFEVLAIRVFKISGLNLKGIMSNAHPEMSSEFGDGKSNIGQSLGSSLWGDKTPTAKGTKEEKKHLM